MNIRTFGRTAAADRHAILHFDGSDPRARFLRCLHCSGLGCGPSGVAAVMRTVHKAAGNTVRRRQSSSGGGGATFSSHLESCFSTETPTSPRTARALAGTQMNPAAQAITREENAQRASAYRSYIDAGI
jgi:hypothetical protein